MSQVTRPHQLLRAHHALKRRQPNPRVSASTRLAAPAGGMHAVASSGLPAPSSAGPHRNAAGHCFERERVRRVGGDFAGPHPRYDLVLADRTERRVRAQRHQRGQRQQLKLRPQGCGQQVLGPAYGLPRCFRRPNEPVRAVPPEHVSGGLGVGAPARDLQHQAGEVASAKSREPFHDFATADRRCDPR